MNPGCQQQAAYQGKQILRDHVRSLAPATRRRHLARIEQFAGTVWTRWQVGPYRLRCKHVRWYMEVPLRDYSRQTRYLHWLTIRRFIVALHKEVWLGRLNGSWTAPRDA